MTIFEICNTGAKVASGFILASNIAEGLIYNKEKALHAHIEPRELDNYGRFNIVVNITTSTTTMPPNSIMFSN
jgi:hypothetical protein